MILGIGVDITPVKRVEKILESSHGQRFLDRVYSVSEIEDCLNSSRPSERLAGVFAAKEATSKALGTGFSKGIYPNLITISNNMEGAPQVRFSGELQELIKQLGVGTIFLSISHINTMACAFVVIERAPLD